MTRQKKLQLSGTIYRFFRLPCVKGFASMRSMLAGLAERGSETAQRLEGFASVRSTLAGLAERGCKKNNPSPPAAELPLHKGAFLIKSRLCRTSSLRFSLLSQKNPARAGFFAHFFISSFLNLYFLSQKRQQTSISSVSEKRSSVSFSEKPRSADKILSLSQSQR